MSGVGWGRVGWRCVASPAAAQAPLLPGVPAALPGDGVGGVVIARPNFVTDFIGSVTTQSNGSTCSECVCCGATWIRKALPVVTTPPPPPVIRQ